MSVAWTDSQLDAIVTNARRLFVSAAAGSGKSSVLTERIIRKITTDATADISRLLVVTFTRSAAAELRMKIEKALTAAVENDPSNGKLSEQLIKLNSAQISTIHGFCYQVIKDYFAECGFSPSCRVGEESEMEKLRLQTMNTLVDAAFAGYIEEINDFDSLADLLVRERDERLPQLLLTIYKKTKNLTNGLSDWAKVRDTLQQNSPFENTPYATEIFSDTVLTFTFHKEEFEGALEFFAGREVYEKNYYEPFQNDILFMNEVILRAKNRDYKALCELFTNYKATPLGRGVRTTSKLKWGTHFKETVRERFKIDVATFYKKYYCYSTDELQYLRAKTADFFDKILMFLARFERQYMIEKRRLDLVDYDDLERLCVNLLYDENGNYSKIASDISQSFDEIFVDEYQDVSPLQNKIFDSVSHKSKLFMVGDNKQSIYAFRGSKSEVFSKYLREFKKLDKNCEISDDTTIYLSHNFRSEQTIINFVNSVFDYIFVSTEKQEHSDGLYNFCIPYSADDRLVYGKNSESKQKNIEINLFDLTDEEKNDSSKPQGELKRIKEAEAIADKIAALVADGVSPSDIAILLRETKTSASFFELALLRRGIAVRSENNTKLFATPEIQLLICLVNCIDNPCKDIYLSGALRSPMFEFELDDLIKIRKFSALPSLFGALEFFYNESPKSETVLLEKCKIFLDFYYKMKKNSLGSTVDRVIWNIFNETSFFSVIHEGGKVSQTVAEIRRSNLIKFHTIACQFSSNENNSLYEFTEMINMLKDEKTSPDAANIPSVKAVSIMTIHKSKGLEFKHCFLCGCHKKLNTEDIRQSVICDDDLGVTSKFKDENNQIYLYDSPFRQALSAKIRRTSLQEELRILYVALTRAKEALYISGCTNGNLYKLHSCFFDSHSPKPLTFAYQPSFLDWILTATFAGMKGFSAFDIYSNGEAVFLEAGVITDGENYNSFADDEDFFYIKPSAPAAVSDPIFAEKCEDLPPPNDSPTELSETEKNEILSQISSRLEYTYPYLNSLNLPSKTSVSRLYPSFLDDNISLEKDISGEHDDYESNKKVPSFLSNETFSAEKGTATHTFMQFCSFDAVEKHGVSAEISRLEKMQFISKKQAEIINRNALRRFFESEIYKEMRAAVDLAREYRFNVMLPADIFAEDVTLKESLKDEKIFVQGIIDGYFSTPSGLTIIDYKTDYIPKELRDDVSAAKFLFDRHRTQLTYYRLALEKLTKKPVIRTCIYSFSTGKHYQEIF